MDLNDSFSTFYPNYFNNQNASVNSWSPNLRAHESKMGTSSNEKFKPEDEFDYHILVESLFNNSAANNNNGKNVSDRLHSNHFDRLVEATKQSNSPMASFKNINWSDFESNYLTKSLTRQLAKTKLSNNQNQPDLLSQLQSDWQTKPNVNAKTVNNQVSNNDMGLNLESRISSMFSRLLEEGYETRLNSSRSSDKSTNRTNLSGTVGSFNSTMNGSLSGSLGYPGIGANALLNNNLLNPQLMNSGLENIGAMNPNLMSTNNLGSNTNARLIRNQLINNQLLNRQILNNQLLNTQMLANQNLFNGANLANTLRSMNYNNDYLVNGQFVGNNDFVSGDFMNNADYLQNNFNVAANGMPMNFYDYNYGYGKFCKPLMKNQFNFKNFKNRPVRKKRSKSELFPLPSLKDADFDKAMEYLKQTLTSLYRDQIMPIYFNVRGRFIEFNSQDIAPEHIMDICKRKPDVFNVVSNGALNETFIYLVEQPEWFTEWVDRNDLTDVYKPEMWEQFFAFIKHYKDEEGNEYFPGSIYGMSRVMQKHKLPFLEGMSLGTICHIVQLAIRLKRYLVYDLKTLKPAEAVKTYEFHEFPEVAPNPEADKALDANEDSNTLNIENNAVVGEKTDVKN